jgi:hypothetical protein
MTHNELIKDIRLLCKNKGLTFKKSSTSLNGKPLYHFIDRQSGIVTLSNMSLMSAYDNALRLQ